jgi:hypothetical protein
VLAKRYINPAEVDVTITVLQPSAEHFWLWVYPGIVVGVCFWLFLAIVMGAIA